MNKNTWRRVIAVLVTLAWTAFVFARSMQTGEESGGESGMVRGLIAGFLRLIGVDDAFLTEHFVRKLAHFTEYAILGFFASFTALFFEKEVRAVRPCALAVSYAALIALTDEFVVQANTPGRGPQLSDVLLDSSGALTASVFVGILLLLWKISKKKKKNY